MSCESNDICEILKVDDDYEMNRITLQIRRRSNKRIVSESLLNNYLRVVLNGKDYYKHIVIAIQFIPNNDPQHKSCIDHIDGDKLNNNVLNLRWCSPKQNANNLHKTKTGRRIEFVNDLPENAIFITHYGPYLFDDYYFVNDRFYKDTRDGRFRIVPWFLDGGCQRVSLTDVNDKKRSVHRKKFLREYDLE